MYGAHDVLEGQVRQRRAPSAVRRERCADDADVYGPLRDRVAHDTHARHLRVCRRLLEVVRAERRDVVDAWSSTALYRQVGDRKIDVEVLGDDFAVDEVVQLWAGQLQWREPPSRRVGVVRGGDGGPRRDCYCGLHRGVGRSIKRMASRPGLGITWVEKRSLINWCRHRRRAGGYREECR